MIEDVRTAVIEGNCYYYIKLKEGESYYKLAASENDIAVIMKAGEAVTIKLDAAADITAKIIPATVIEYKK